MGLVCFRRGGAYLVSGCPPFPRRPQMFEADLEIPVKVLIVGNGAVGKSSMIQRYCKGIYTNDYKKTIGVDFLEKKIKSVVCYVGAAWRAAASPGGRSSRAAWRAKISA